MGMSNVDNGIERVGEVGEIEDTSKDAEVVALCSCCYGGGLVAVYAVDSYEAVVAFCASVVLCWWRGG